MRSLLIVFALSFVIGCGSGEYKASSGGPERAPMISVDYSYAEESNELVFDLTAVNSDTLSDGRRYRNADYLIAQAGEIAGSDAPASGADTPPPATAGRKIIYNADVRLVVADLAEFLAAVRKSIASQGGFVGSSTETGMDGSNPSATLVVRVPSQGYGKVLDAVDSLGTVEQRSETSRDVTSQFVDVAARIRNKQREEERLIELLADATGKLVDILEVEKELSRVRGEIEQAQGQMNVLSDQIGLATITINASERTVYTPPTPSLFGDRVSAAWSNSTRNLGEFFTRSTVELVAFIPWLTVWVPICLAIYVVVRVVRRIGRTKVSGISDSAT